MALTAIRLIGLGQADWLRTQSVYHALAEGMTDTTPDTILLTQPRQPYVCLGYHQELDAVLDRAACGRMGLPIVRRRVGGGATYLDEQQLFYQCVFHHTRVPATVSQVYAKLLAAPVAVLRALGLPAELRGENEIEVNRRRIAGIGGGRIGEAAVVVGNILFDFDYDRMVQAWRTPSESFRNLAAEALKERVTTLRAELSRPCSFAAAQGQLVSEFAGAIGRPIETGELTVGEMAKVEELERRLVSAAWLNLHANGGQAMTTLKIARGVFIEAAEAKLPECHLRATFRVRDGLIERAVLVSDPGRDWDTVQFRLRGTKLGAWVSAVRAMDGQIPLP